MEEQTMTDIKKQIESRRSVRTYDGLPLSESLREQLLTYANSIENPFGIPAEFRLLDAKKFGLSCPVVTGTELFVGGKVKNSPDASLAFGYSFEEFVLYARSIGLGTVWIGGTMNRDAFEKAMELSEDEIMPCVSPIGVTAKKMSIRESLMRKGVKADERLPFEELFFDGSFDTPLRKENAGVFAEPLEMVRLAPSAVNKQPWRVVISDNAAHFYLMRSKGFGHSERLDMQMVDIGIALCHFALSAKDKGYYMTFLKKQPANTADNGAEYICSYVIE